MEKSTNGPKKERGETEKVARAAGTIGLFTFGSRVLGFIRDVVVARAFGASLVADAFFVALRIPNMLRELLAEGSMSAAFVPVFTEKLTQDTRERAWALASRVFTVLLVVLVVVTCLGILAAPLIVRLIAPGFTDAGGQRELTVLLTRIMFPYLLFIGLAALAMGILNSLRAFALPALSPMCLNISIIACALWLAPGMDTPALGLAIGVLVGGIAQLAIQLPGLASHKMMPRLAWAPKDPDVRRIGKLILPMLFGLSVTQVNLLVNTLLASFLQEGSVSFLYYGIRLIHFPLGIFGVALATAILPSLSASAAKGDLAAVGRGFSDGLRLILFITIPAMLGLIVLSSPIVQTLFERGAFDAADTVGVAAAVSAYATGLWAFAGVRITASAYYAMKDTATPVKVAAVAMITNIILNLALMGPLGHAGLALATAIAAMVNLGLLVFLVRKKLPEAQLSRVLPSLGRTLAAGAVMTAFCLWVAGQPVWQDGLFATRAAWLCAAVLGSSVLYMVTHRLLGGEEVITLMKVVRRRK